MHDGYYHLEPERSIHPAYPFRMSTRDLARFGLLFARTGRWNNAQIVPSSWVNESTRSYSSTGQPATPGYGYMWWRLGAGFERYGAYAARGTGEQMIAIVPDLKLVFIHLVDTYEVEGERVPTAGILALLKRLVDARAGESKADARLIPLAGADGRIRTVQLPVETLRRYARTYSYASGRNIEVTMADGELRAHFRLRGTFALLPVSETEFLLEDAGEHVFFHTEGGQPSFIVEGLLLAEGRDLLRRDKADEALAMFQRATSFYPNSAASHVALAQTQQMMKNTGGASRNFAKAIELDPGNPEAAAALQQLGSRQVVTGSVSPRFAELTGTYRVPGLTAEARVTHDGDQLLITLPALSSPCSLIPVSQNVFLCRVNDPRTITFERNSDGAVARLVVRTANGTRTYERMR